jgi:hypothetical protein
MAILHPKAASLSSREIARWVGVHHQTVENHRDRICLNSTDSRTITRNGTTYTMQTGLIDRVTGTPPPSHPSATREPLELSRHASQYPRKF